jgi:hypothetical protein
LWEVELNLSKQYPMAGFGIIDVEVWFRSLRSYSSTLKIEVTFPPKRMLTSKGLHSVIPQKIERALHNHECQNLR